MNNRLLKLNTAYYLYYIITINRFVVIGLFNSTPDLAVDR